MSGDKQKTNDQSRGPVSYKESLLEALDAQSSWGDDQVRLGQQKLVAQIRSGTEELGPPSRRYWQPLMAVAALLALALGVWLYRPLISGWGGSSAARETTAVVFNAVWREGAKSPLAVGVTATVPEGMGAQLRISSRSAVWVGEHTTFSLRAPDGGSLSLNGGKILVSIAGEEVRRFAVETPHGQVVVHGTVFSVSSDDTETTVRLYDGEVSLHSPNDARIVEPGQSATLTPGASVQVLPLSMIDAMADLLIAEPFVKNHGDPAPHVPDILALAEELTGQVELVEPEPAPKPLSPFRRASRPSRVIEAKTDQIRVKRVDTASKPPDLEQISDEKEERALFDELKKLFDKRDCEPVVEKCVEYIRKFPEGAHDDQVIYYKGYCQAYLGDLSGGKESLEVYFSRYRDGRYWNSIKDILKE